MSLSSRVNDLINGLQLDDLVKIFCFPVFFFFFLTCIAKLKVMNSQIGFKPLKAEPTAIPAKPISVMGVSMTRLGPNLSNKPLVT